MNFNNLIGNEKRKEELSNIIQKDTVSHSYLWVGKEGIGKKQFARKFAQAILCEKNKGEEVPCKECKSCIEYETNNNPDFMHIESDGKSIKIEQIRMMQEKMAEKPIISQKKVYIINDSDLMTKEAQNCLLKTLEEPPEYAVIILIAANENKLLNTIKSRCIIMPFYPIQDIELQEYIKKEQPEVVIHQNLLKASGGSLGKLLSLAENKEIYERLDSCIHSLCTKDIVDIWQDSDVLYKEKERIQEMLEYMIVSLYSLAQEKNYARGYLNAIPMIEETKTRLVFNSNYDMCIDYMLLKIWEEMNEEYCRS